MPKERIVCIPGLGGHPSVFAEYHDLLPEYRLRLIGFVNRQKALEDARAAIAEEEGPVALFCHCYSAQMGIQLAAEMPGKVSKLILLEPFFSEFKPWMRILRWINWVILQFMKLLDLLGVRRKKFSYLPDYVALAKYPIFVQPFFDMRWQNLTDYFEKCYDILTYKLPHSVETTTLMIFSPQGFSTNPDTRERVGKIFLSASMVETEAGTHNVITMGADPVAAAIREFLNQEK